jgi:hypothetical protein
MKGYPEYPTIEDAYLLENAEKADMRSFKRAKELALFVREIVIWQDRLPPEPADPELEFFIAELHRQGLDVKFTKNCHWS